MGEESNADGMRHAETNVQVGVVHGGVHVHTPERSLPLPRGLPSPAMYFTDRDDLMDELEYLLRSAREEGAPLVVVFVGPAGIGKSELAARWLSRIGKDVPGPHLYADLSKEGMASPKTMLGSFLRSMGVHPDDVPQSLTEMTVRFRSLTHDRATIVLLDDVTLASQVRPFVPSAPGSIMVATTRKELDNLPNAVHLYVEELDEEASALLIGRVAGPVDGVETLVQLCKGSPLSLRTAGKQVARRRRSGGALAEQVRAEGNDDVMMALFDVGYRGLSPEAARAYRCLGALFERYFTAELAAAAAGLDDPAPVLAELVEAGLVESHYSAYRLHDLALDHARVQAEQDELEAAQHRVVLWYLRKAVAADFTVMPGRWWLGPEYDRYRGGPLPMEREAAWQWLEDNRAPMLAAIRTSMERGWYDLTLQLVEAQWSLCFKGKHYDHWISAFELGLDAAIRLRDRKFEGRMRCQLGFGYVEVKRLDEAAEQFAKASEADQSVDHVRGQATAVESLGLLDLRRSGAEILPDLEADASFAAKALELLTENLTLNLSMAEENDDDRAVALAWRHRGRALSAAGRHEEAISHLVRARELIAAVPDPYNEGRALTDLGQAYLRAGRNTEAAPVLHEAVDILGTDENRVERAVARATLGIAAKRSGDHPAAESWLTQALEVLDGRPVSKVKELQKLLQWLTAQA